MLIASFSAKLRKLVGLKTGLSMNKFTFSGDMGKFGFKQAS